ncbi:MAG TPA: DMT family transporter [Candidatus Sulfotelmatobacter sp.]|jgi:drug/metabolite transporter (DMT)-like permease|nr:DMT family transporter [Candidatus Sulfotelmatobacter sp.]
MSKNTSKKKGILLLLLAAFLYSIMPVLIRLIGNNGIPPISQVSLRYTIAFLCALIYYIVIAKAKFFLPKKHVPLLLFAAIVGYGLTNVFYTIGILNTLVSTTLFLFYTYAIIAPILGFFLLKEKVNKFNIISLALSFIALILLFQPTAFVTWKIGGIFAILSALATALYLIARKKLHEYRASYMMLINTFLGMLSIGILGIILEHSFYFHGGILHVSPSTWFVTILFGIDNFAAWLAMTKGFEYFQATSSSLILLSELIFGIFFAFLFFHEIPTYTTFIGGLLIIVASVVVLLKGEI